MAGKKKRIEKKVQGLSQKLSRDILETLIPSKHYFPTEIADKVGLILEKVIDDKKPGVNNRRILSSVLNHLVSQSLLAEENGKFILQYEKELSNDDLIVGVVQKNGENSFVEPSNAELSKIPLNSCNVPDGHIVSVRPTDEFNSAADIVVDHGSFEKQEGVCKLVALDAGIPIEFPKAVLEEVANFKVPEVSPTRKDFRNIPFLTIDPETAKDFDDAICVRKKGKNWIVMVAVADVDHYVRPGTATFEEAYRRGNSVYLPGYTVPMIPEVLSNGLCSLKPNEDRAALVITTEIDPDGNVVKRNYERGLIKSIARLTYDEVQDAIMGKAEKSVMTLYNKYIKKAHKAFDVLVAEKDRRGALDLNVKEQRNDISKDGVNLKLESGNESHGIIEQCMIRANRTAIEILDERKSNLLARVHGEPHEKLLDDNADYLKRLGVVINNDLPIGERVRDIVAQAKDHKNGDKIRQTMIRVQDRAGYKVGVGYHYGLALDKYGHFTSPIRRFSDLVNHHQLFAGAGDVHPFFEKDNLTEVAKHINGTEIRAEEAERECNQKFAAQWVAGHIGENFNACVVGKDQNTISVKVSHPKIMTTIEVTDPSRYKMRSSIEISPKKANVITGVIEFKLASDMTSNVVHLGHGVNGAGQPYKKKHPRPRIKKNRSQPMVAKA